MPEAFTERKSKVLELLSPGPKPRGKEYPAKSIGVTVMVEPTDTPDTVAEAPLIENWMVFALATCAATVSARPANTRPKTCVSIWPSTNPFCGFR